MSENGTGAHLVLVGMMGAGKTIVGRACASRLGRRFVDTDSLVETQTGRTVAEIFATDGEPAFRAHERTAVAEASAAAEPLVIACGGGAVLDPENRRVLHAHGVVVWLRASPEVLAGRVAGQASVRPLLAGASSADDAAARLRDLEARRSEAYEAAAHVTVDTSGCSVDEVAAAVLEEFARCRV